MTESVSDLTTVNQFEDLEKKKLLHCREDGIVKKDDVLKGLTWDYATRRCAVEAELRILMKFRRDHYCFKPKPRSG